MQLDIDPDEAETLLETLDIAVADAEKLLDEHVDEDRMPDTVDEFLAVVTTQQGRVHNLKALAEKVRRLR